MKHVVGGLGGLLLVCLAVRLAAWLIADAVVPLAFLFLLAVLTQLLLTRQRRW
jgi:hypothetical protein